MIDSILLERHGFTYVATNRWVKPGGGGVVSKSKDGVWHSSVLGAGYELDVLLANIDEHMESRNEHFHEVLNKLSIAAGVPVDQLANSWGRHLPLRGQDATKCKLYISRLCAGTGVYNKIAAYTGAC